MSSGQSSGEAAAPSTGLGRLSESEAKLVAKLLSDPTYFPIEFRTWLKQFIEGSGIIITAGQVQGGSGSNLSTGLPPGMILPVATSGALPIDCLTCDGSAKVRTDYPLLFGVLGTTWGAGDGSTTFNIPDLRDRALFGAGGIVGIGQTDGVAFGSRGGPNHHHSVSIPNTSSGYNTLNGGTDGVGDHGHGYSDLRPVFQSIQGGTQGSFWAIATQESDIGRGTGGAGGHSHGVSVGGTVTVSGTVNGNTSGGGGLLPSYAGILWAITIGTVG